MAAGHWDPWSRPVEFKMKEVNRRIGGLYSMFVKGGTEGNTLKEAKGVGSAPPEAEASSTSSTATSFNWKRAIKKALKSAPEQQLKVKALRKAILREYAASTGGVGSGDGKEAARKTFKSRLKKADYVALTGKVVKLRRS